MASGVEITADGRDFVQFFGKTSKVAPALKRSLRKRIKQHAEQVAAEVKAEVQKPPLERGDTPIPGRPRSRGLRRNIAAGVGVSLAASDRAQGAVIRAKASSLPADQKRLLKLYNREKGWRRPDIGTARSIAIGTSNAQVLRAMGSSGAASGVVQTARDYGTWHEQKGRPYFGKVIERRHEQMRQVALDAIQEARASVGL